MRANILHHYKGIIDSTLREGMQYRFANFTVAQQKEIVRLLTLIGVDRIEVGNPISESVRKTIAELAKIKKRKPLLAHIRNRFSDIQAAKDSGIEGVHILCSIEKNRLQAMKQTLSAYIQELERCILFAKEYALEVRVSVEHFFRSQNADALRVYRLAESLQVNRIGVADTTGMAMNWDVERAIKDIRRTFTTEIEVHFHNDLGQANSNAIAALKTGANWVDTTLLGIGERNGIPALSIFLSSLYRLDQSIVKRYHLDALTKAENVVAHMLGQEVPFNLLTNRKNGFAHKAGVHLHGIVTLGPQTYELFPPGIIGNTRKVLTGTIISGKTTQKDINQVYQKYGRT